MLLIGLLVGVLVLDEGLGLLSFNPDDAFLIGLLSVLLIGLLFMFLIGLLSVLLIGLLFMFRIGLLSKFASSFLLGVLLPLALESCLALSLYCISVDLSLFIFSYQRIILYSTFSSILFVSLSLGKGLKSIFLVESEDIQWSKNLHRTIIIFLYLKECIRVI